MGGGTVIIYMTILTYKSGHKEVKFSGNKNQWGGIKGHIRWLGVTKLELKEIHLSASDFVTIETVTSD